MYLLSVNMIQKKRCMIFDSGMKTHEESHVLRWLEWNFMLVHWEFFFGAATFLFVLDSLCLF